MRLTAIVPIYGFDPNRETALKILVECIKEQDLFEYGEDSKPKANKNYDVIFVEQAKSQDQFDKFALTGSEREYLQNLPENMIHIILPYQENGFNKAWCMNVGAKEAKSDRLVFLDADTLFDKNFFHRIADFGDANKSLFYMCWDYIINMPGKDQPTVRIYEKTLQTAGGVFAVDKAFYWSIGGMCENYFGHGGEDNDFWFRANHKLGSKEKNNVPNMPYALLHWYHDWAIPSDKRYYFLDRTTENINEIINRLKSAELGNKKFPTMINFDDLQVNKE